MKNGEKWCTVVKNICVPVVQSQLLLTIPVQITTASAEVDQGRQWYWYVVLATCKREHLKLEEPLEITFTFSNPGLLFACARTESQINMVKRWLLLPPFLKGSTEYLGNALVRIYTTFSCDCCHSFGQRDLLDAATNVPSCA